MHNPLLPDLPPIGPTYAFEARRAGPDGFFWPVARQDMQSNRAIVERMAEDLVRLTGGAPREDAPPVTRDDMVRLGWDRDVVEHLGPAAVAELLRGELARRVETLAREAIASRPAFLIDPSAMTGGA